MICINFAWMSYIYILTIPREFEKFLLLTFFGDIYIYIYNSLYQTFSAYSGNYNILHVLI